VGEQKNMTIFCTAMINDRSTYDRKMGVNLIHKSKCGPWWYIVYLL